MKKYFWLLLSLFIISRFLFLANYPHFYDSPEYYQLSQTNNFYQSVVQSHQSIHPLYLFLIQVCQRLFGSFSHQPQILPVSFVSAIFGLIGFLVFYFLMKRLFNKRTALLSLVPLIFFPHLWLVQTNVLHETVEQNLFLLGLLFFDMFLEKKKIALLTLAIISWALAILNFIGILIWFPGIIGLIIFRSQRKNCLKNISWGFIAGLTSCLLSLMAIYKILLSSITDPLSRLKLLIIDHGGGNLLSGWTFLNLLRVLRNDWLIAVNGYSIFVTLAAILVFLNLLKEKQYRVLFLAVSFLIPFFLTGKFWYGGLFGRYSALVAYPLTLLLVNIPSKKIYWLTICLLIIVFVPTFVAYQRTPIPNIQSSLINQSNLGKEDLLILSDYQRPQLVYDNALYLNGDLETQKKIETEIETALGKSQKVLISQQAMTFPYWQYDGQQIHIISKGDKEKAQLKQFLNTKIVLLAAQNKKYPLLSIYQIKSTEINSLLNL